MKGDARIANLERQAQGRVPQRGDILARYERQVDPEGRLSDRDRVRRAEAALRANMLRLANRSAKSRAKDRPPKPPSDATARRRAKDRARAAERYYAQTHGISVARYGEILESQGGVCALCHEPPGRRRLIVDPDPTTGGVRGLLCQGCRSMVLGHEAFVAHPGGAAYLG